MKRTGFILGTILILSCNGIVLLTTFWSRSGSPLQTVTLTERELPIHLQEGWDDSSVSLHLAWNKPIPGVAWQGSKEPVLSVAKLQQLGFSCPILTDMSEAHQPLPMVVFASFEFGGSDSAASTPLRLVDASKNLQELLSRYPDRQKHLIVRTVIEARLEGNWDPRTGVWKPDHWVGRLAYVLPSDVHVPLPLAKKFRSLNSRVGDSPRYSVTLHYGRNLEPWIVSVE